MQYLKDERVKHPLRPQWGAGKILDVLPNNKVRVFFVGVGEKIISTAHVELLKITGDEASHPLLEHLRTTKQGKVYKFTSLAELVIIFLGEFADGFYGDDYMQNERNYKIEAHKQMVDLLGQESFASLISNSNYDEICRRSLQIANKTNLIYKNEKILLRERLKTDMNKKLFSEALNSLLYNNDQIETRFNNFSQVLIDIDVAKWTIVSYFLFITFPKEYMFMKPSVTQDAADACAFELNYRPEINWLTYNCLLTFSQYLFKSLAELKPRDMIDIQSFIWCVARIAQGEYQKQ